MNPGLILSGLLTKPFRDLYEYMPRMKSKNLFQVDQSSQTGLKLPILQLRDVSSIDSLVPFKVNLSQPQFYASFSHNLPDNRLWRRLRRNLVRTGMIFFRHHTGSYFLGSGR